MNVVCKITYRKGRSFNIEDILKYDIMCGLSNLEIIERSLSHYKKLHNSELQTIVITKIEVYKE